MPKKTVSKKKHNHKTVQKKTKAHDVAITITDRACASTQKHTFAENTVARA